MPDVEAALGDPAAHRPGQVRDERNPGRNHQVFPGGKVVGHGTGIPIAVLLALLLLLGVGVGFGLGNEMILIQRNVERRDLGTATTGVRFVETLGTSVAAAAFAALFAAVTARGQLGPAHVMGAFDVIFAVGAGLLAVATAIATRLPAGRGAHPAAEEPGGEPGEDPGGS